MHLLANVIRQSLLFVHALTFAFAIVTMLRADVALLTARHIDPRRLTRTERILVRLLGLLWGTGIGLTYFDIGLDLGALADRPQLAAKLSAVVALTVLAVLMRTAAFPRLTQRQKARRRAATISTAIGVASTVTWLFAAFLSVARGIDPAIGYVGFMALYAVGLVVGGIVGRELVQPRIVRLMKRHEPNAKIEQALFAVLGRAASVMLDLPTRRAHSGQPWAYAHALAARIPASLAADRNAFLTRVQPLMQGDR